MSSDAVQVSKQIVCWANNSFGFDYEYIQLYLNNIELKLNDTYDTLLGFRLKHLHSQHLHHIATFQAHNDHHGK